MSSKKYTDQFSEWNDTTGAIHKHSSWYYECESILHDADIEIANLKEELEKVTKIADVVCMVYGDAFNDDPDSDYNNEFARQKQKELKEILQKKLGVDK